MTWHALPVRPWWQDPALLVPGPPPGIRAPNVTYTSGFLPDKTPDPPVPDTVPVIREDEEGEAMCLIEDNANYKVELCEECPPRHPPH